uniref:Uncharacterized protein n=1 Tax=Candidatus Kentrum sp. UNK TaxID=2126344 RepID=A0A451AY44_9GAMM|nr:MAG: hypothetical protein BECKUNK1418G_GA0071005_10355 [Candidatus Kentron sp. UNK]VFK70867.1 MAG: hypothetical protein BECKUNK1418H_GA0071006_10415 [Candidatus Kentron sp. UNK]
MDFNGYSLAKLRLEPTRHDPNAGTAGTRKVAESVAGTLRSEPPVDNVQSLGARFAGPQPPLFKIFRVTDSPGLAALGKSRLQGV